MIQAPTVITPTALTPGNPPPVFEGNTLSGDSGAKKSRGKRKSTSGSSGARSSADELTISIDPSKYGSPMQGWSVAQKAIWFLHVVTTTTGTKNLSCYSIAKNFNKHFKSSGALNAANVSRSLEKERLKGTDATVGNEIIAERRRNTSRSVCWGWKSPPFSCRHMRLDGLEGCHLPRYIRSPHEKYLYSTLSPGMGAVLYNSGFSAPVNLGNSVTAASQSGRFVEYIQNGGNGGAITVQDLPQGTGTLTNLAGTECELIPENQLP
jgi:hypothetical protein